MRVVIPQIAWHARDPVLTLDFDPKGKTAEGYYRLATGGADRLLLIWHLSNPTNLKPDIVCVSELTRRQKGINVCRFSPCGNYIASGDDDSYVFIWKNESISEKEEVWNVEKIFRRHVEDVSDLCWSPDSNYLISGSVDNTAVLWDVKKGTPIHFWSEREHTGFVQGVAYDPLGEFSVTMCIDRFFSNKNGKIMSKTLKYPGAWLGFSEDDDPKENTPGTAQLPLTNSKQDVDASKEPNEETSNNAEQPTDFTPSSIPSSQSSSDIMPSEVLEQSTPALVSEDIRDKPLSEINGEEQLPFKLPPKRPATTLNRLFHDDSLKTFCRRISCSPRGELMIVPGGLLPPVEKVAERDTSRQSTPVEGEDDESKEKEKAAKKFDPEQNNAVIIFCRNSWSNPCAVISTGASYSIAAKFNPVYFEKERKAYEYDPELVNSNKRNERTISCVGKLRAPRTEEKILLDMPYRLVYAVANNDSLLIGDTASAEPLACIRNIHCTRMTDISWSPDGLVLIASSTDGFCSILTFEKGELGAEFKVEGEEFPALTPTSFLIAAPEPKPVKKEEPKEPKEPKEVKEKKEPVEKKEKVKELKEKKEKKEKVKEATPSFENQEDKKKKTLTIPVMLATAKNSPSSASNAGAQVERLKLADSGASTSSPSTNAATTPISENATPKRSGTILNFFKKTPKSSNPENKTPRRVQLITLASSSDSDKLKPTNLDPVAQSEEKITNKMTEPSPKAAPEKQPRRIELVPNVVSESSSKAAPEKQPRRIELVPNVVSESSSKPPSEKQPRRIELVTNVVSKTSPKSASVKQPRRIELVTNVASETSPKPVPVKQPRRVELVTNVASETSSKPAPEKQPRRVELVTNVASETSPKPAPVKQPRRVELVTLDDDDEPKTKRRAVEDAVIENQPVVECNQNVN